uniref:Uncharacterized protein n=1 Tax=Arundo donax TaxID=35708 RepID=A0A0A9EKL2_ARUDO
MVVWSGGMRLMMRNGSSSSSVVGAALHPRHHVLHRHA